jgi:hypothetical protein
MVTRSRFFVTARCPALIRGVRNSSFSRSFSERASTKVTLGAPSFSPAALPPLVMARVRPSSMRWQSWGLLP